MSAERRRDRVPLVVLSHLHVPRVVGRGAHVLPVDAAPEPPVGPRVAHRLPQHAAHHLGARELQRQGPGYGLLVLYSTRSAPMTWTTH